MNQTMFRSTKSLYSRICVLFILLFEFYLFLLVTGCASPRIKWEFYTDISVDAKRIVTRKPLVDWISKHKLTGRLVVSVSENGKATPVFSGVFVDGLQNGKSMTWYSDGQLWEDAEYHNGYLHGSVHHYYFGQGNRQFSAQVYSNGMQIGIAKYWYSNGVVMPVEKAPKNMSLE